MSNTPDPNGEDNFDFDGLEGEGDPFADPPDEATGADPFDFAAEEAGESPVPTAPPTASSPAAKAPNAPPAAGNAAPSPKVARNPGQSASLATDMPVQVVAVLGKKAITVGDLIALKKGEVIELNRFPNEAIDLVANGKLMAKGELVEIDGKLGVRIIKIFE